MKKITQAIERYRMLQKGDSVVVGLSGGADSVVLTHFLHRYGAKVYAVHINHLLRGEESLRDEAFVTAFCEQLGIPCRIYRLNIVDIAAEKKQSIELVGREERYRCFALEAKRHQAVIATAHTLSDQAETVLFRLMRGSGLKGLAGIPAIRTGADGIRIIRPLIDVSREEIEAYSAEYGLRYVVDSSNLEDDYTRNRIRHRMIPLCRQINSAAEQHIGEFATDAATDEAFLAETADIAYTKCKSKQGICAKELIGLHPAIRNRVLRLFLAEHGIISDRLLVERLNGLAEKDGFSDPELRHGEESLPGNRRCFLRGGQLYVAAEFENVDFPILSKRMKDMPFEMLMPSGRKWCLALSDTKPIQNVHKNLYLFCLDYDKIKGKLECRGRMTADRLEIAGRKVSKTVKKWMNEAKVPPELRSRLFILSDEEGVIMVEGLGIASRVAADEKTERFLVVYAER